MGRSGGLVEVIGRLIMAKKKGSVKLSRGLVLGYSPGGRGERARLVWSRKESEPSAAEDEIMGKAIGQVLGVDVGVEGGQEILEGWGSSVAEWDWSEEEEE